MRGILAAPCIGSGYGSEANCGNINLYSNSVLDLSMSGGDVSVACIGKGAGAYNCYIDVYMVMGSYIVYC